MAKPYIHMTCVPWALSRTSKVWKKIVKHLEDGYIAIGVQYIQVTHLFQNGYSCSSFECLQKVINWFILLIEDVDIMHVDTLWQKKTGFACKINCLLTSTPLDVRLPCWHKLLDWMEVHLKLIWGIHAQLCNRDIKTFL